MIDPDVAASLREWLRAGEPLELVVATGSMAPAIRPGDRVRVVETGSSRLRPGQVLLLDMAGAYVIHRLIWRERRLWTRGDAAPHFDAPLRPDAAIGRVIAVARPDEWEELPATPPSIPLLVDLLRVMLSHYRRAVVRRLRDSLRR